jgi:hypothetical protein
MLKLPLALDLAVDALCLVALIAASVGFCALAHGITGGHV